MSYHRSPDIDPLAAFANIDTFGLKRNFFSTPLIPMATSRAPSHHCARRMPAIFLATLLVGRTATKASAESRSHHCHYASDHAHRPPPTFSAEVQHIAGMDEWARLLWDKTRVVFSLNILAGEGSTSEQYIFFRVLIST